MPLLPPPPPAPVLKPLPPHPPPAPQPKPLLPSPPPPEKPAPVPSPKRVPEPLPAFRTPPEEPAHPSEAKHEAKLPVPEPEPEPLPVQELPPVPPPKPEPEAEPVPKDVPDLVLKPTPAPEPASEVAPTVPSPPPSPSPPIKREERQTSLPSQKQGEIREFFRTRLMKLRGMFANFGRVIIAREDTSRPASAAAPQSDQSPCSPHKRPIFFKTPELNLNAAFETTIADVPCNAKADVKQSSEIEVDKMEARPASAAAPQSDQSPRRPHKRPIFKTPELNLSAAFETTLADVPCDAKADVKQSSEIEVDKMEARMPHHSLEPRSHSTKLGGERPLAPARLNIVADFKPLPAEGALPDIRRTVYTAPPTKLEPAVSPATARIVLPSSPSALSKTTMLLTAQFVPPLDASKDRIEAEAGVIARPTVSRIGSRRQRNTARPRKSRRLTRTQIRAVFEPVTTVERSRYAEASQAGACGSETRVREPFSPWLLGIEDEFEWEQQQQTASVPPSGFVNVPATIRTIGKRDLAQEALIDYRTVASASGLRHASLPQAPRPFSGFAPGPASVGSLKATIRTTPAEPSPLAVPEQAALQVLPPSSQLPTPSAVPWRLQPPPRSARRQDLMLFPDTTLSTAESVAEEPQ
ncbi:proteoglycan 4-like [Rhipicephalus sanguineus]|uniref:proteoglycan 4-like n=1 Tax=Rhipicephalus sanguineus TaxID=34632 RepID=UPI001894196E|nr:proteoglycan 4-like [Rhipicephalus sanguineus]